MGCGASKDKKAAGAPAAKAEEKVSGTKDVNLSVVAEETKQVEAPKAEAAAPKPKKEVTPLEKFHSAIRWGKPIADIEPLATGEDGTDFTKEANTQNGNFALHLSAQNGHIEITKWLMETKGADVNCTNGKQQTPLHMSIAYDFYEQSQYLMDNGANQDAENCDGHKAITGIDGDHVGKEAWMSPMQLLRMIKDEDSMKTAFDALEACEPNMIDKVGAAQAGMKLKKKDELKDVWDKERFMAIIGRAE